MKPGDYQLRTSVLVCEQSPGEDVVLFVVCLLCFFRHLCLWTAPCTGSSTAWLFVLWILRWKTAQESSHCAIHLVKDSSRTGGITLVAYIFSTRITICLIFIVFHVDRYRLVSDQAIWLFVSSYYQSMLLPPRSVRLLHHYRVRVRRE